MHRPADDRAADGEIVGAEHDEVGTGADLDPAPVAVTEHVGRRRARRRERVGERDAGGVDDVADRLVHRQRRPGQGAVGEAGRAVDHGDAGGRPSCPARHATASVTSAIRAGALGSERDAEQRRVDVDEVGDEPGDDAVVGQGGADDARLAVVQRRPCR